MEPVNDYPILLTFDQLKQICPALPKKAGAYIPYLNQFMPQYGIDTPERIRMFIAQVAHESGQFKYTREIASGKQYEGREDLGNIHKGDGVKYKGRGLIQLTGRYNYAKCSKALDVDFIKNPELLSTPEYAVQSACWFWQDRNLNRYANDIRKCTKAINGGYNGLEERRLFWQRAKKVIK